MAVFGQNKKEPENTDPPQRRSATPTRSSGSGESSSDQPSACNEAEQPDTGNAHRADGENSMVQLENLLNNLRSQQHECLANELFEDAREFQRAIDNVIDAKESGTGLTSDLLFQVRNTFQRMFRKARNRGEEWLSQAYKIYVGDMQELLK